MLAPLANARPRALSFRPPHPALSRHPGASFARLDLTRGTTDSAVERAVSLMAANSATHVIILSHDPVDVIVLAVPVISADPATETALALVRRLLALTPEAA